MSSETALARLLLWQAEIPKQITDMQAFEDLGLAEEDISALLTTYPDCLTVDAIDEFPCPDCNSIVELPKGANTAYCESCGRLWKEGQFPKKEYSLDRGACASALVRQVKAGIDASGWKVVTGEGLVQLSTSFENMPIGIGVFARAAKIRDYLAVRGSLEDPLQSVMMLLAPYFEDVLQYYVQNSPEAVLIDTLDVLEKGFPIVPILEERARYVEASKRVSSLVGTHFEELRIADDIAKEMDDLLRQLPFLALQIGAGSSSAIGIKFQRAVITVLNLFTPLKVMPVGGANHEDGVLRLYFPGTIDRAQWYPVGIKSFKGSLQEDPYYPLKEADQQMRRYARAYRREESIAREIDVPGYILVAHDFDIGTSESKAVIGGFRSETGISLKLLSIKTLVSLAEGFVKLHPDQVPNEIVSRHLSNSGAYLDAAWAQALMNDLSARLDQEKRDPKVKRVRDLLRKRAS
jgi:hypothetical protein